MVQCTFFLKKKEPQLDQRNSPKSQIGFQQSGKIPDPELSPLSKNND